MLNNLNFRNLNQWFNKLHREQGDHKIASDLFFPREFRSDKDSLTLQTLC